ncbi:DUF350 domain-containing protein [Heliobacterium gestii]|uniref:DUF350 domain-containing protein n=1 Tax=Heliomicrobium gestii TaxID=2699 RepID=A0A845L7A2_HELGE|nr:DUF350 domain-containing protein [Heliomicrobium gestii]MBM7866106.1 putative membrane protein [Heliomicrobium gestii]MZP42567.1 DUF350 domain-containing protein [Heliomicrobium gestii]
MVPENFLNALLYFAVSALILSFAVWVFFRVTPYDDSEEIQKGNGAVGLTLFAKMFGLGLILWSAISHNDTLQETVIWGLFGAALMIFSYLLFDWMTPKLSTREELQKGNMAVAWVQSGIFITLGVIINACIS